MRADLPLLARLESALKTVAAAAMGGMALVTGADVLCRGLFNTPILGSEDVVSALAVVAVGFALMHTHADEGNIGVEFLYVRLPRAARRGLRLFAEAAGCALFCVVAWQMALYAASMRRSGEVSMTLELPTWLVVAALGLGFACLALQQLANVVALIRGGEGR